MNGWSSLPKRATADKVADVLGINRIVSGPARPASHKLFFCSPYVRSEESKVCRLPPPHLPIWHETTGEVESASTQNHISFFGGFSDSEFLAN